MSSLIEWLGEPALLTAGGFVIGLGFGFFAQRSAFCLRAAVIEFWRGEPGQKLAVWLLAFSAAVVGVQVLVLSGAMEVTGARQLATRESLSGALIGGLVRGGDDHDARVRQPAAGADGERQSARSVVGPDLRGDGSGLPRRRTGPAAKRRQPVVDG